MEVRYETRCGSRWSRQRMLTLYRCGCSGVLVGRTGDGVGIRRRRLTAQDYPVAIQRGACATLTSEPDLYDFMGVLSPRPVLNIEEETYVDRPLPDEDLNDDGVTGPAEDLTTMADRLRIRSRRQ